MQVYLKNYSLLQTVSIYYPYSQYKLLQNLHLLTKQSKYFDSLVVEVDSDDLLDKPIPTELEVVALHLVEV